MSNFALVETFDSLAEMIEYASGPTDMTYDRSSQKRTAHQSNWTLTDSFDHAVEVATTGFVEAEERAQAIASEITSKVRKVMTEEVTLEYDMTGTVLDVDAYLTGEANCIMQPVVHHQERVAPTCRILVNCAFSGGTSTDFYIQQGAVVIALCDLLREAGYATEVWACSTNQGNRDRKISFAARVKAFDDYGSVTSMLFGLAHPSFQRRLVFSCRERMDASLRREFGVGSSYGHSVEPHLPGEEFDITIGNGTHGLTRNPVDYILSTLKGLGVEIAD